MIQNGFAWPIFIKFMVFWKCYIRLPSGLGECFRNFNASTTLEWKMVLFLIRYSRLSLSDSTAVALQGFHLFVWTLMIDSFISSFLTKYDKNRAHKNKVRWNIPACARMSVLYWTFKIYFAIWIHGVLYIFLLCNLCSLIFTVTGELLSLQVCGSFLW